MTEDNWRDRVLARLDGVESRLSAVETKNAVDEVHRTNVESRLSSIEDTLKWLLRLVIGGMLVAFVAFVVKGGLVL